MKKILSPVLVSAMTLMATANFAIAEEKKPVLTGETVVVEVDGDNYTWGDVVKMAQLSGIPFQQIHPRDLVKIISTRILIAKNNDDLLDDNKEAQKQLQAYTSALTFELLVREKRKEFVKEKDVQAEYKKILETFDATEVKARHILLKTEKEANAVIASLKKGAKFADLAKKKSTGPSAKSGGDLGWFSKGQMVPEFEKATLALKKGKYTTKPVKTQFGYHVIKLEDTRKKPKPTLAEIKGQIENKLFERKMNEYLEKASTDSDIEYQNQDLLPAKQ